MPSLGMAMLFSLLALFLVSASTPADYLPGKAAAQDLVSLMRERSPGARPEGALTSSKPRRQPVNRPFPPPLAPDAPTDLPLTPFDVPLVALPEEPLAVFPDEPFVFVDAGAVVDGPFGFITPGFWLPGGPGGPGVPGGPGGGIVDRPPGEPPIEQPFPPSPPASAVPEPASWAMMILGLGAIGAAQRRSKRRLAVQ